MKNHETLSSALDADLDRMGMTQAGLAARLSGDDAEVLTEQAVSMWKRRNKIPRKRVYQIAEMFGPNSTLVQYLFPDGMPSADEPVRARPSIQDADDLSPLAAAIGIMFDSLPGDQVLRATVFGEVTTAILNAKREHAQQSGQASALSRGTQRA